jgi:23S rRNA pseudouridine2605 synthase
MNNETSNPMPESAAASPEAEPVKKTRKPRAAKADGAKDAAEAKKPAAPRKRAGVKRTLLPRPSLRASA